MEDNRQGGGVDLITLPLQLFSYYSLYNISNLNVFAMEKDAV